MPEQLAGYSQVVAEGGLAEREAAMLDALYHDLDAPVNRADLVEQHPHIKWQGNIRHSWDKLLRVKLLENHLVSYGDGSNTMYTLLSKQNDVGLLEARLEDMQGRFERLYPDSQHSRAWLRRVEAIGAIATVLSGGIALAVHMRRKKTIK